MLPEVLLNLLSHVENRAIATRADDVLVKRSLALLALSPDFAVDRFEMVPLCDDFAINIRFAAFAVIAQGAFLDDTPACDALKLDLDELH